MNRIPRRTWLALFVVSLSCALGFAGTEPGAGRQESLTPAAARAELDAMYALWSRARVEQDRETLTALLAPDFVLLVDGTKSTGTEFVGQVTGAQGGVKLARFDAEILTLRRTGATWTAVIAERLEWELPGPGGKPRKISDLWVTRDVCGKQDGEWRFHSSEALGNESWPEGVKPPLRAW